MFALLLTLAVPGAALSTDQGMMREWYRANETCRGTSDATGAKACGERDKLERQLQQAGWCWAYSDPSIIPVDYEWHRCEVERPATTATPAREPNLDAAPYPPGFWAMLIIGTVFYLAPTIVAALRRHRNLPAIAVLNIVAGWTFIGWVGALIWSLLRDTPRS